jgi:hypothetical protein
MDSIKIKGQIDFKITRANGLVEEWSVNNLITSAGKAAIAGLVGNTGAVTAFTYLAVGTSNTAPAIGQTALIGEISTNSLARAAATVSRVTTTVTNDTLQLNYTWTASGSSSIEEVGIFNASSSGTMLGRALTSTKSVVSGDTLQITYKIIFS